MQRAGKRVRSSDPDTAEIVHAFGQCVALFATILDRNDLIAIDEVAATLSDFATITSVERPEQGQLLRLWSDYVADAAASVGVANAQDSSSGTD